MPTDPRFEEALTGYRRACQHAVVEWPLREGEILPSTMGEAAAVLRALFSEVAADAERINWLADRAAHKETATLNLSEDDRAFWIEDDWGGKTWSGETIRAAIDAARSDLMDLALFSEVATAREAAFASVEHALTQEWNRVLRNSPVERHEGLKDSLQRAINCLAVARTSSPAGTAEEPT